VPNFEPASTAHSIERCALAFNFSHELPPKVLNRALDQSIAAFRNAGLERKEMHGFQIDLAEGKTVPLSSGGPVQFISADKSTILVFNTNSVVLRTGRYVRWSPFIGQVEELLMPIIRQYCESVNLLSINLEYLDAFRWTGTWENFQWRDLLEETNGFIASKASAAQKQWHAHSGWFDFFPSGIRRLTKVNIDIVERLLDGEKIPTITILSGLKDEAFASLGDPVTTSLECDAIMSRLEDLHSELKGLLKGLLKDQMAERIGL
jgi:uncharacterized protein (TIGR04255 family)